jgi:hypothetical protein
VGQDNKQLFDTMLDVEVVTKLFIYFPDMAFLNSFLFTACGPNDTGTSNLFLCITSLKGLRVYIAHFDT